MKVLHVSMECYPAAKTGGLGDVVGALPKYQNLNGQEATVIIPKYSNSWINNIETQVLFAYNLQLANYSFPVSIERCTSPLGFDLLFVNIEGLFDRNGVYGDEHGFFQDEFERIITFNKAVLDWICQTGQNFDIIHCHDHHTGLIPFFMSHIDDYSLLKNTPSIFTIHNGKYQSRYSWRLIQYLPVFNHQLGGLLEWDDQLNFLASGVKNSWKFTTVSESYLEELTIDSDGLEWLFRNEKNKSIGILNGIDIVEWNPKTDDKITFKLKTSVKNFKHKNRDSLQELLSIDNDFLIFAFIGRLVFEKGVDFIIELIVQYLTNTQKLVQFIILGTGDPRFENALKILQSSHPERVRVILKYDEKLAHQIYAGSDFLLMPSRVEPCGLNQFYALRYGTIPIVRRIGGLADSIKDISLEAGNGISFDHLEIWEGINSLERAKQLYQDKAMFDEVRNQIIAEDHSWTASVEKYQRIYEEVLNYKKLEL